MSEISNIQIESLNLGLKDIVARDKTVEIENNFRDKTVEIENKLSSRPPIIVKPSDKQEKIQGILDSGEKNIYFSGGTYLVGRTVGDVDRWGYRISNSNMNIVLDKNAIIKRKDTIVNDGDGYPMFFVGVPDSVDGSTLIENIEISGGIIEGDDIRHNIVGSVPVDYRTGIHISNVKNVFIHDIKFTKIDSTAIETVNNGMGGNGVYSKVYNLKVKDNEFIGTKHSVIGRALLHTINVSGIDGAEITNNYVEWCDCFISGEGTYLHPFQKETDTYVYNGVPQKRTGRGWTISNNRIYNSSEHPLYIAGVDVSVIGNIIWTDNPTVCIGDVKVRGRGCNVSDNNITARNECVSIHQYSSDVMISGNILTSLVDVPNNDSATIYIRSVGIASWLKDRAVCFGNSYPTMSGISIDNNIIKRPTSIGVNDVGILVYTDNTLPSEYVGRSEIVGMTITNNNIYNAKYAFLFINNFAKYTLIKGNMIIGKPFNEGGFSKSVTLNSKAVFATYGTSSGLVGLYTNMTDNHIVGFENLFGSYGSSQPNVGTQRYPDFTNNRLFYIQNLRQRREDGSGSMFLSLGYTWGVRFTNNTGFFILDREIGTGTGNSLGDGISSEGNKNSCMEKTGGVVRVYTDDNGGYVTIGS